MAHMVDHSAPSLLVALDQAGGRGAHPGLRDDVVAGCEREAAGRSIDELVAERDAGVIAVLRALGRV